ncbi:MAG: DUF3817 domain-containing protein [Opitutales bacterium]|jgi:integral membrane protein
MKALVPTVRLTGQIEALSYLALLGIAMPLKYFLGQPAAVQVVGMAHGLLWIAYVGLAGLGYLQRRWSLRTASLLLLASLLPFGPFVADARLLRPLEAAK